MALRLGAGIMQRQIQLAFNYEEFDDRMRVGRGGGGSCRAKANK
jgi:hypothetical protein